MNRASGTYVTIPNCLIIMSSESPKKRRKNSMLKIVWINTGWKFPQFDKIHKFINSRDEWTPNKINQKKSIDNDSIMELLKNKNKEKNLKKETLQKWKSSTLLKGEQWFQWLWISPKKSWRQEGNDSIFKYLENKQTNKQTVNPEFYITWKYQEWKWAKDILRWRETSLLEEWF